jgi:DNA-binding transcriptional ArsR family regulator
MLWHSSTVPRAIPEEVSLDAGALKALADPLRLRVLLSVRRQPRTVKDLAAVLGVPQTRLYYHVKLLEQHGLIRVVDRRMVSGIEERTYSATAMRMTTPPDLSGGDIELSGVVDALMGAVSAEIQVALHEEPAALAGAPDSTVPVLQLAEANLSPEQVAALQARIVELVDEFDRDDDRSNPAYRLVFATYRVPGSSL